MGLDQKPAGAWKAIAAVALFAAVYLATSGLDHRQRAVAATFATAVFLWMTEALPLAVTAVASTAALIVTGAQGHKEAFGAYGDQIILLFVGSFILAKSMEVSGLDRRLSLWLLARPACTKSPGAILLTLGVIACTISLFVSNTATTAMLLPIGLTMLKSIKSDGKADPIATSILLMLTWGSSVAVGTIIGTPPNVIGVGLIREATGESIGFLEWGLFAMPITIVMLAVAWLQLKIRFQKAKVATAEAHQTAVAEYRQLGAMRDSEKITILGFFVALILWLLPGIVEYSAGSGTPIAKVYMDRLPEAVAAWAGAVLLFVIPCRDRESGRALTWKEATRIEWGTVLLFAGGLALGKAAFDSGLAKTVGDTIATQFGLTDMWAIAAVSTALAIVVSELASNTASATTVVPIAIALAQGAGANPIPAALGAVIGSNLGFMLPISTAPNAIVYSTGLIPARTMMKTGAVFDVVGFIVTMAVLRLVLPPLGLAN